ncbi:hypothetical protein ETU10_08950 [Apibacter muscae]|uniref:hypothetical protein n=1 Tax=Apibacter muscae TaxID=2509004 RepID=UPI0011ACFB55|nr:hypothetical protein [Apibacter muscae]TWP22715.1 hypothetical protein ETU10_08950 [Apibacter muscae]
MKIIVIHLFSFIFILNGCANNQRQNDVNHSPIMEEFEFEQSVPFTIAENYFSNEDLNSFITIVSQSEFDQYIGMATTMGKHGQPTPIDFKKQWVIAVALPSTDINTQLIPISLKKDGKGKIIFTFKAVEGNKLSYKIKPFLAIIVDRKYLGEIQVIKI